MNECLPLTQTVGFALQVARIFIGSFILQLIMKKLCQKVFILNSVLNLDGICK